MRWLLRLVAQLTHRGSCRRATLSVDIVNHEHFHPQVRVQLLCNCTGVELLLGTSDFNAATADLIVATLTHNARYVRSQIQQSESAD